MSKRKGAAKRRRKRPAAVCARCHAPAGTSPQAVLAALAAVLNTAEDAGMRLRLRHGAVQCREGVVLPPLEKGQRWAARTRTYDPLSPPEDTAGDGLDD